jgi:type IV pilus assembly protein PilQ
MQPQPFINRLNNINFTRGTSGEALVIVEFDNSTVKPQLIEAQGKLVVTFSSVDVADDQLVEIDVTEFATPVSVIESFADDKDARIEARYSGQVAVDTKVEDNRLTIQVRSLTPEQAAAGKVEEIYEGKPISLDFQDVPVRQVLQIIAQVNGFNLVTTDTVNGNVTIKLSNIPWDQALAMILKIKALDKRMEGNILLIAPAEELAAREAADLQSIQ